MILLPQLAESVDPKNIDRYVTNDHWVMEQKLDGHRLVMHIFDGDAQPMNRRGTRYDRLPNWFLDGWSHFRGTWIFDGEWLHGCYHVFDLLEAHDGTSEIVSPAMPWHQRREALETLIQLWEPDEKYIRLVPTARTADEKRGLANTIILMGGEGMMLKHVDGSYQAGRRVRTVLKCKLQKTCDCFIIELNRKGKEAVGLGVFDENDKIVEIGACSVTGKRGNGLQLGDVLEVRYLYATDDRRLFQPSMLRRRTDKAPQACTIDQLVYTDKTAI